MVRVTLGDDWRNRETPVMVERVSVWMLMVRFDGRGSKVEISGAAARRSRWMILCRVWRASPPG